MAATPSSLPAVPPAMTPGFIVVRLGVTAGFDGGGLARVLELSIVVAVVFFVQLVGERIDALPELEADA